MVKQVVSRQPSQAEPEAQEALPEIGVDDKMRGVSFRPNVFWHPSKVSPAARQTLFTQLPATAWLTGLSGAGKSTLAFELERLMLEHGRKCFVLDGDNIRHRLNCDLGFSPAHRKENIRRVAEVAHLMNEAGLIVVAAFISPYREDRELARSIIGSDRFVEVHVSTAASVCATRDPKGLYAKAHAGEVRDFTGVSAPYEAPLVPDIEVDAGALSIEDATRTVFTHLAVRFFR